VKLPAKIPVYIVYFTTYVQNDRLYFGNDLYNRDDKLVASVASAAAGDSASARAVQTLRETRAE
jgi:murein L,D-transpeptidase YcbB/YkuD